MSPREANSLYGDLKKTRECLLLSGDLHLLFLVSPQFGGGMNRNIMCACICDCAPRLGRPALPHPTATASQYAPSPFALPLWRAARSPRA